MSRRNYMSSRRRSRRGRLFLILAVVVVFFGGWWMFSGGEAESGEEQTAAETTMAANDDDTTKTAPRRILDTATMTTNTAPTGNSGEARTRPSQVPTGASVANAKPTTSDPVTAPAPKPVKQAPIETANNQQPVVNPGTSTASAKLASAFELARSNPVEARRVLTEAWIEGGLSTTEQMEAANLAGMLSDIVLFDPRMINNDPFTRRYTVKGGDALERIVRKEGIETEWLFLARINKLRNANAIRPGQTLKLPVGTFHAVVDKDNYRLDLYQDNGTERVLVTTLNVGLGEFDGTPTGLFGVRPASKLINPVWIDPRTHKEYAANDPANPIGEHWIGIRGLEPHNRDLDGFGIHGPIEPNSIGQQQSMGCVRLLPEDVALVYEVLTQPNSTINIVQANRIAVDSPQE